MLPWCFMPLNYFASVCSFIIPLGRGASAQPWRSADLSSVGWSVEQLKAAQDYAHAVAICRSASLTQTIMWLTE